MYNIYIDQKLKEQKERQEKEKRDIQNNEILRKSKMIILTIFL